MYLPGLIRYNSLECFALSRIACTLFSEATWPYVKISGSESIIKPRWKSFFSSSLSRNWSTGVNISISTASLISKCIQGRPLNQLLSGPTSSAETLLGLVPRSQGWYFVLMWNRFLKSTDLLICTTRFLWKVLIFFLSVVAQQRAILLSEKLYIMLESTHSFKASLIVQLRLPDPISATSSPIGMVQVSAQSSDFPTRSWQDQLPSCFLNPPQAPRISTSSAASPPHNILMLQSIASSGILALLNLRPLSFSKNINSWSHLFRNSCGMLSFHPTVALQVARKSRLVPARAGDRNPR